MSANRKRDRTVIPELHRLGLAVVLSIVLGMQVWVSSTVRLAGQPAPVLLIGALALLTALPLITVGRWPLASLALMSLGLIGYRFGGLPEGLVWVGPLVGVYTVTNLKGRRFGFASAFLIAAVLAFPLGDALTPIGLAVSFARSLALTVAAAAFGESNRARREREREAVLRAEQAEQARAAEAARVVDEERLRIARELHDVTAHSLSVIAIQAELAKRSLRADPDTAGGAIDAIGDTSRQALGELRTMLGQLRGGDQPSMAPSPSLALAPELAKQLGDAGVTATLELPETLPSLPPFVDATAYRILQEATTNTIRHSGAHAARLAVDVVGTTLRLVVEDDGRGTEPGNPHGHGILGMRERATALGGTLEAGLMAGGGWRVEARLPLPAATDAEMP